MARPSPSSVATIAARWALACGTALGALAGPTSSARAEDDPFHALPPRGVRPGPGVPDAAAARAEPAEKPPDLASYRAWLVRDDWLCRALAARELRLRSDDGVIEALGNALAHEAEPRVVGVLLGSLAGRARADLLAEGGVALAGRLVELLGHANPLVRGRALAALAPFPPVRLPPDVATFEAWWARGRDGLATEVALARERRAAIAAAARPTGPRETTTVAPLAMRRYADLERIQREGLEVVICLDQTGSMEEVIDAAKASIVDLVRRMRDLAPKFRVGLVTYDDEAFVRLSLTTDETLLEREFRRIRADGGGDEEEGVDKAIVTAMDQRKLAWSRKAMRVLVVVGDAPPHPEDVDGLLRTIHARRDDPLFEAPLRIDTISTLAGGDATDALVPHFAAIAHAGRGAALRLASARQLATELLLAPFGPSWREPLRGLLAELDTFPR